MSLERWQQISLSCLAFVAALASGGGTAFAQTAQLTGRISDASSAVLPGAAITVTNTDTGISRKPISNGEGYYAAPFLPAGTYRITVELAGFRPITRDEVTLSINQVARIDFVLELAGFQEEVEAPLRERETASVGQVIDNRTIVTLPLNGRNYSQLALLTPGAVANPAARAADAFNLNGNRSFQNNFLIDGLDNNNYLFGVGTGSAQAIRP